MVVWFRVLAIGLACLAAWGVGSPVWAELAGKPRHRRFHTYRVHRGDTLYRVARRYHVHPHQLARYNHLKAPDALQVGQRLRVPYTPLRMRVVHHLSWVWPTQGRIIHGSGLAFAKKHGILIQGQLDQPVYASANGRVTYAGHGLPGYGNLLIVRHQNGFVSVYAFNDRLLVSEGQQVRSGQKIAQMGGVRQGQALLYFELRHLGQPKDPLHYLPKK